jgi:outer membrane lipoprotein-sorting protein
MLKDKISFFDDAVIVLEVKSSIDMNEVSVTSNKEPGLGQITFKFKSNKFIGWRTVDAMGIETEINLSNAKNEQTLDASLFRYDKPKNYSSEEKIDF